MSTTDDIFRFMYSTVLSSKTTAVVYEHVETETEITVEIHNNRVDEVAFKASQFNINDLTAVFVDFRDHVLARINPIHANLILDELTIIPYTGGVTVQVN